MVLDLEHGRRVYDWLGRHRVLYRLIRCGVCFGREKLFQRTAMAALELTAGDVVLDLACGTGANLGHLQGKVGTAGRIIAVDFSSGMLDAARAQAEANRWTNIEFRRADAARLELPPESLDGAICTFGLSAMPGELEAIKHMADALKSGANFVVLDCKAFTGVARIFNPIAGPVFKYGTNWDYHKDVIKGLREVFPEVGVREFNSGCNYLAIAKRKQDRSLARRKPTNQMVQE